MHKLLFILLCVSLFACDGKDEAYFNEKKAQQDAAHILNLSELLGYLANSWEAAAPAFTTNKPVVENRSGTASQTVRVYFKDDKAPALLYLSHIIETAPDSIGNIQLLASVKTNAECRACFKYFDSKILALSSFKIIKMYLVDERMVTLPEFKGSRQELLNTLDNNPDYGAIIAYESAIARFVSYYWGKSTIQYSLDIYDKRLYPIY